ncbi:MAG: AMP-binding protein [Solirubrobacteraceae bacterium]
MSARTFCEAFQASAAVDPDAVALRTPGDARTVTWRAYADEVEAIAGGLDGIGVGRGDTVALMMGNRIEFHPIDVAAQHVGATSFSVYNTLAPGQLGEVLSNAGNRVMLCESRYVDVIRRSGVPVEHLVCVDGRPEGAMTLDELKARARPDFDFERTWRAVQPDDVVTLIYTSGTTGPPKGVEITHEALLYSTSVLDDLIGIRRGDRMISYLPSAHIVDRFVSLYIQALYGTQTTVVDDIKEVAGALSDTHPAVFPAVPRIWEKLRAGILGVVDREADPERRKGLEWALDVAARRGAAEVAGEEMSAELAQEWKQADELVLSKIRHQLGLGAVRWAISGGAPVPQDTLGFFAGLGIPIGENWGMSELGPFASASVPGSVRLGTVGRPLPGVEMRTEPDGELLVRGPLVMKGYRRDPERTAEVLDDDGWLRTGDLATIDDDGYLRIVGRKKDLIITSGGKNLSPAGIENAVRAACPLIGNVVAVGDGRPFVTALVVLDAEGAAQFADRNGIADHAAASLAAEPAVVDALRAGVANANATLSRVEQIKRFLVLPAYWEPGGDELTLTAKVRREAVVTRYAAEIERLYAAQPQGGVHEPATGATVDA